MKFVVFLALLSTTAFAQFGTGTGVSPTTAAAIEWGKSVNPNSYTFASFSLNNGQSVAKLHQSLFNLAPRDEKLEADVAVRIAPVLAKLNFSNRIAILVVADDRIPYARITKDGVFIITSVLARKEFGTGRDFAVGTFLRELARTRLLSEFGQAATEASSEKLQIIDLKVTAAASLLSKMTDVSPNTLKAAITQFNAKVKGTPSTYETDKRLFATEFQPVTTQPKTKLGRFMSNVASSPSRTYDELHAKGLNFAPTEDHFQVIAYFNK